MDPLQDRRQARKIQPCHSTVDPRRSSWRPLRQFSANSAFRSFGRRERGERAAEIAERPESLPNEPKLRTHSPVPPEAVYNPLAIFAAVENRLCPSPR